MWYQLLSNTKNIKNTKNYSGAQVYNPDQDIWSPVSDMSARRYFQLLFFLSEILHLNFGRHYFDSLFFFFCQIRSRCWGSKWIVVQVTKSHSYDIKIVWQIIKILPNWGRVGCLVFLVPLFHQQNILVQMKWLSNSSLSVGGHDGPLVRKSVESYNPDTNR